MGGKKAEGTVKMPEKTVVIKPDFNTLVKNPSAFIGSFPEEALMFVAGASAGAFAKTCTAPLDRVKILAQVGAGGKGLNMTGPVAEAARKHGSLAAMKAIFVHEGLGGFWKGNLAQVARAIPYDALRLGSYDVAKSALTKRKRRIAEAKLARDTEEYNKSGKKGTKAPELGPISLSVPERLAAGAFAGTFSTFVTFPLDTVRTRLAVESNLNGIGQAVRFMYKEGGIKPFYRGLNPSLLGIAPYIAINYCAYDLLKSDGSPIAGNAPLAALIATLSATAFTYPLDTIRRVQMLDKTGKCGWTGKVGMDILKDRGIAGLYGGIVPNVMKNSPTNTARLVAYDINKKLIGKAKKDHQDLCVVKTV